MPKKLSAAIMAHPARVAEVADLKVRLDYPAPVAWATNANPSGLPADRWRTGKAAWKMFDSDADYHLVLQDDALPCPDFIAGLERALGHVPDGHVASAYFGHRESSPSAKNAAAIARYEGFAAEANERNASWIVTRELVWGVAILVPTAYIRDMLATCGRHYGANYDLRIGRYFRDAGTPAWHVWPSLVDHRRGPSLVGHDDAARYAHRVYDGSALRVNLDGPVVVDPRLKTGRFGLYDFATATPRARSRV